IQAHVSTRRHLVVIRGTARITLNNQSRRLTIGESVTLSENQSIMFENVEKEPIDMMNITLGFKKF
ncbi:MAG: hypothetical protein PVJ06_14000, partial [Desulfobacterales bacterium]